MSAREKMETLKRLTTKMTLEEMKGRTHLEAWQMACRKVETHRQQKPTGPSSGDTDTTGSGLVGLGKEGLK